MLLRLFNSFCVCVAASLLILAAGCGGESVNSTGTLTGTVSSKGTPYASCKVQILRVGTSVVKGRMVDENGKFRFEEVPFGDYQLSVRQFVDPYTTGDIPFDKNIPKKYRSHKTSGLEVSVPTSEEVVFDFNME